MMTLTTAVPNRVSERSHLRADIQGLRGIAILIAVSWHAGLPLSGGYVAFDMFFVISGFVIAGMLLREHRQDGRIDLRRFYVRRFRRLMPALAVMLMATIVVSSLVLSPTQPQRAVYESAFGALFLYANYAVANVSGDYFGPAAELNPLLHTWSLSLEEQVYLVFPLLLLIAWRLSKRGRGPSVAVVLAGTAVISFGWAVLSAGGGDVLGLPTSLGGYYGPAGRFWEFLCGALLALVLPALPGRAAFGARRWGSVVGLGSLLLSILILTETSPHPGAATLWPVASMLLVLACEGDGPGGRLLRQRHLGGLGDMSYSWYLWHWPVISLVIASGGGLLATAAAAALSLLPAWFSYRYLELPFRGRRHSGWPMRSIIRRLVAPAFALACVLALAVQVDYGSTEVQKFVLADRQHLPDTEECGLRERPCRFNAEASGPPVYLVGDSTAEQYAEGLTIAAESLGRPVVVLTRGGCPPMDVFVSYSSEIFADSSSQSRACGEAFERWQGQLRSEPGTVVVGLSPIYFLDPQMGLGSDGGTTSRGQEAKELVGRSGLTRMLQSFAAAGHDPVVLQPIPYQPLDLDWGPQKCSVLAMAIRDCTLSPARSDVLAQEAGIREFVAEVGAQFGARVLDPLTLLCDDDSCPSEKGGIVQYRDFAHISVATSEQFAPEWLALLGTGPPR